MEYVALVMSYVLNWWSTTDIDLGLITIPSIFGFLVACWIFKNAICIIREYIFDEVI